LFSICAGALQAGDNRTLRIDPLFTFSQPSITKAS
jgi:hypothetical protein